MLNLLWCVMMLIGIVYGAFNGTMPEITDAALDSAREAVSLCISIAGVVAFWNGLMRIAEESGMVQAAAGKLRPFLLWLMPGLKGRTRALEYISTNMIANVLGLGWAATPAGLKAMEELRRLDEEQRQGRLGGTAENAGTASDEMCTFLLINISSLQLIPINIIAYRSQYGSVNPTAIVGPGLAATAVSTVAAIIFCKMMNGKRRT
ncbi:MAG TPA: nucleoside recognition protein [Lachnospiraceae bacterium]|nr:nucleoside recognition protein [Lachnospiraceae bacterium]